MTKPMLDAWHYQDVSGQGALAPLLACMLDEIWEIAAPDQAAAFLRGVGGRLAHGNPLDALHSNAEILATINGYWASLGWGAVDLEFVDDTLRLNHVDLPPAPEDVPAGRWNDTLGAVLAGAYDGWLAALGGGATMHTRLVAIRGHDAEFHYGA
jgi:hypothetical protein